MRPISEQDLPRAGDLGLERGAGELTAMGWVGLAVIMLGVVLVAWVTLYATFALMEFVGNRLKERGEK